METIDETLKHLEHQLRYNSGPAMSYVRVGVRDLQLLLELAKNGRDLEKSLNRSIKHATTRVSLIKESQGDNPGKTHNYYGGQSLGYWEGRLSALRDMKDRTEVEENSDEASSI